MKISRVLIANRGEIAVRVIRACQELGLETVLATSDADRLSMPAQLADHVVCIGGARSIDSYLNPRAIVAAALGTGSDAVHPGYGFLSESPVLVETCNEAGITFVGPSAEHMRSMGNKIQARLRAELAGVPTLPGSEKIASAAEAIQIAERVGYPVMMKAAGGGGGRGMHVVTDPGTMEDVYAVASAEADAAFGDATLYMERYLPNARHIEVQVLGDTFGNLVQLGDRDCSLQRRHQKIVEEAPASELSSSLRAEIRAAAVLLASAIGYHSAGTVEFLVDVDEGQYYFLEMNTRIQVEHTVSEMITGIDLVEEQFYVAAGEQLSFDQHDIIFRGHAIECRVNAELAEQGFRPNAGRIEHWSPPIGPNIRLDTHCFEGYQVPIYYDSMLAKLIVYGSTRAEAINRMSSALARFDVVGVATTIPFLRFIFGGDAFVNSQINTQLIDDRLIPEYTALLSGATDFT
jgi:acetyl-CoA carboxylase biotin carboxylase subunit